MKLRLLLGVLAFAASIAEPAIAENPVKIGFITKFPVPFFATMENAAKAYAADHPGVEIIFGQGTSATDIEGQIALIESMVTKGVQGIAITPVDPTVAAALDKAIGAGVKVEASEKIGLKIQGKYNPTYLDEDYGGVWCDPFYCYQVSDPDYLDQGEFSAGLTYKLGSD